MIAGIKLYCKKSVKLERQGLEKRKMRITQGVAGLIAYSPLDNGEAPSNDSGVARVVVLLVVKSNGRHQHPKIEPKKTGLAESVGSTQFAAVLVTASS